jgi:predicted 3-demethylubiquinone-9 3-methyltransferase (glyoxalase superfamily)
MSLMTGGGSSQRCGWITDRYGVSWQIMPAALGIMMMDRNPAKNRRVTEALLAMVKLDANAHESAYRGSSAA